MRRCRAGSRAARVHEVFAEGPAERGRDRLHRRPCGARDARGGRWSGCGRIFAEIESGALSMSGLAELGLDPRCVVTVRAADVESALRTAADALACDALGAVVLEVWGEARQLDLVASRKLTLAAQASGVTALAAAARGGAAAFDRGDADGSCARRIRRRIGLERWGAPVLRRATRSQSSWPGRAVDHGMEM